MPGSKGDGNGYIAQVKEMELLRRDNQRMVDQKDVLIDHARNQLNFANGTIRELNALSTHHVRTAFGLGAGAGVIVCLIVWGLALLLK
jgi:phosphomevalonate kinase